jgi:hypothetical protein
VRLAVLHIEPDMCQTIAANEHRRVSTNNVSKPLWVRIGEKFGYLALSILFNIELKRVADGGLCFADTRRLQNACSWLRNNADGQRVDPNGTALTVVGII